MSSGPGVTLNSAGPRPAPHTGTVCPLRLVRARGHHSAGGTRQQAGVALGPGWARVRTGVLDLSLTVPSKATRRRLPRGSKQGRPRFSGGGLLQPRCPSAHQSWVMDVKSECPRRKEQCLQRPRTIKIPFGTRVLCVVLALPLSRSLPVQCHLLPGTHVCPGSQL